MREEKGITLVALIITIIVLLILAVVTISAVNEGSLFSHANNAATTYSEAADEENTLITGYISKLEQYEGKDEIYPDLDKGPTGCIIDHLYEFEPIEGTTLEIVFKIFSNGDNLWGTSGIDGSNEITPYSTCMEAIENGSSMASGNVISFITGNNKYQTFVFNGETATVYINATTLGGTDGVVSAVTK